MNPLTWLNTGGVWAEVTAGAIRVEHAGRTQTWTLERTVSGELTEAFRSRWAAELPAFLDRKPWQPKGSVRCALSAAGVTLRRWKVPRGGIEDTRRVLMLQMEAEIPLPPEDLVWGWMKLGEVGAMQEVLVAAVRRRAIEPFTTVFESAGLVPRFTLSALIRAKALVARPVARDGEVWLDVGPDQSEWLLLDEGGPQRMRVIPWGEHSIVRAWVDRQGVTVEAAGGWLERIVADSKALDEAGRAGWDSAVQGLVDGLPSPVSASRICLTGRLAGVPAFVAAFGAAWQRKHGTASSAVDVVASELAPKQGVGDGVLEGAADGFEVVRAMRDAMPGGGREEGLWLTTTTEESPAVLAQPAPRRWALVAAALLLALLATPYLEALILYPGVARRVAAVRAREDVLKTIDRQADFLRHLRQNQTPYLDALLVLGKTVPPGSKLESLNLNRKGEMSLRITVRQPQDAPGFRTKLTESGFFSSVVIEEQTPSPDRQKIQVRLSAQLEPANRRQGLKILSVETAESKPAGAAAGPKEGVPGPVRKRS